MLNAENKGIVGGQKVKNNKGGNKMYKYKVNTIEFKMNLLTFKLKKYENKLDAIAYNVKQTYLIDNNAYIDESDIYQNTIEWIIKRIQKDNFNYINFSYFLRTFKYHAKSSLNTEINRLKRYRGVPLEKEDNEGNTYFITDTTLHAIKDQVYENEKELKDYIRQYGKDYIGLYQLLMAGYTRREINNQFNKDMRRDITFLKEIITSYLFKADLPERAMKEVKQEKLIFFNNKGNKTRSL